VALVTRAFLFSAYPSKMSGDSVFVSLGDATPVDGYSGATPLGQLATATGDNVHILGVDGQILDFSNLFWGTIPGSWGETSTFCILIGAVILLCTGMASWKIMLSAFVGGLGMSYLGCAIGNPAYPVSMVYPIDQLCLGGFMFAIVFMATDPVTSCRTETGKWIYGFLIGVLAMTIRFYNTGYPEGAMLAVLLMNCFAPLIDWCVVNSNIRRRMKRLAA
ncbi:MAG: RnfABCDGE type electron transport complex subunit D, partial [Muribaculaceae bacterium]|nr:RnfABCDGE type electron transport complex subunit D [Muribaculaceae bacterium]